MVGDGKIGQRHRIRRIEYDRLDEQAPRLGHIFPRESADMPMYPHHAVPCIELARVLAPRLLHLGGDDAGPGVATTIELKEPPETPIAAEKGRKSDLEEIESSRVFVGCPPVRLLRWGSYWLGVKIFGLNHFELV